MMNHTNLTQISGCMTVWFLPLKDKKLGFISHTKKIFNKSCSMHVGLFQMVYYNNLTNHISKDLKRKGQNENKFEFYHLFPSYWGKYSNLSVDMKFQLYQIMYSIKWAKVSRYKMLTIWTYYFRDWSDLNAIRSQSHESTEINHWKVAKHKTWKYSMCFETYLKT